MSEDDFWQIDPDAIDLDRAVLSEHEDLCRNTGADCCLVVHRGKIVSEWYGPLYRLPIQAMSSTKSVTSLLVGLLVDEGKLKSLDVPVGEWLPSWRSGDKSKVTVRHLMSQTAGLKRRPGDDAVGWVADKNPYVESLPLDWAPGTRWEYSNEGTQLLSPILDAVAGEPIQNYAQRRLFGPLGMRDSGLNIDAAGHAWTYADMLTSPRDLARVGLLVLQGGMWRGERIISESWLAESTAPQPLNGDYGLLWWRIDGGIAALGYLDTNVFIYPSLDLLVVRMQRTPTDSPGWRRDAPAIIRAIRRLNGPA